MPLWQPPRRALTCSMTLLNNTSKLSAQKDEPSHWLSSPEDMCNLWPSNKLEEEVGGEPLFLFLCLLHHLIMISTLGQVMSKRHAGFGGSSGPQIPHCRRGNALYTSSQRNGQACLTIQLVDTAASLSTEYMFLLHPRRIFRFPPS
jgi:hypothetical protein